MSRLYRIVPLVLVLIVGCAAAPVQPNAVAEAKSFAVPVVEIAGSPENLGVAHGEALGEPIRFLLDTYFGSYFRTSLQKSVAMMAAAAFRPHLAAEHREEIRVLAETVGLDQREALLAQCFLDLTAAIGCSTITLPASASTDGVGRFGRNLDFPSFGVADRHSVVMIFRPEGRYAFASVGWPGMIGVLTGMNEHGLTLANMEVRRSLRLPAAMPYTLLYRTVLEQCRTVEEAIELLEQTPRQSANNLMLMDAGGDRAVVEITPESVAVRRAPEGSPLISTNHQRGEDLEEAGRCRRYDRLQREGTAQFGEIGVRDIELMLDGVAQGKMTMQSMVFEPSTRVLHLAVGQEATKQAYQRLDLAEFFERALVGVP